jgi:hypothetical protein
MVGYSEITIWRVAHPCAAYRGKVGKHTTRIPDQSPQTPEGPELRSFLDLFLDCLWANCIKLPRCPTSAQIVRPETESEVSWQLPGTSTVPRPSIPFALSRFR